MSIRFGLGIVLATFMTGAALAAPMSPEEKAVLQQQCAGDFTTFCAGVVHDACATRDVEFGDRTVQAADVHAAYMSALGWTYGKVVSSDEFLAR